MTTENKSGEEHYAKINQPFADGHYDFCFGWDQATEWEEKYPGRSLFNTFNLMHRSGIFLIGDIKEVIRLALIGGGKSPFDSVRLVERYVEKRPITENMALTLMILEAAFFGENIPQPDKADLDA